MHSPDYTKKRRSFTPAELLLGRPTQDNFPRKIQRDRINEEIIKRLGERQQWQKHYFDRDTKPPPPQLRLLPRQPINIQEPTTLKWKPAVIKESIPTLPRSYTMTTPKGRTLRRNRQQIKEAPASTKHGEVQPRQDQSAVTNHSNPQVNHCMTRSGRGVRPPACVRFNEGWTAETYEHSLNILIYRTWVNVCYRWEKERCNDMHIHPPLNMSMRN